MNNSQNINLLTEGLSKKMMGILRSRCFFLGNLFSAAVNTQYSLIGGILSGSEALLR